MTYLRFGVRDLLWAMVVVGLVIGWWVDRRQTVNHYRARERAFESRDFVFGLGRLIESEGYNWNTDKGDLLWIRDKAGNVKYLHQLPPEPDPFAGIADPFSN